MKKTIAALSFAAIIFGAGCTVSNEPSGKIKVAASFYPLAEFARQVGGSNVDVFTVTPPGAEPHEYEPTPKDITEINGSKILILNGGGQDEWGEKMKEELQQKGIVVIDMSDSVRFITSDGAEQGGKDQGNESGLDPHIWLDPVLAQTEVEVIGNALSQIDPANAEKYSANMDQYKKELIALDNEYREGLKTCKRRDFVTSHRAFSYLAKRYNLNQIAVAGLSTEEEPSAKRIAEIADLAKEKGIRYIFFETLVSSKLSETIANEIGAQTLVLNPIEGLTPDDATAGKNYATLMQENLKNLRIALECE